MRGRPLRLLTFLWIVDSLNSVRKPMKILKYKMLY
jgi:hypothetical protein